jgi:CRISPR/Cas system-associated exonuclease Cas4 (RecB family)
MSYRTFHASEIGEYLYCRRAWWLRHSGEQQSYNVDELDAGNAYHHEHHRAVTRTNFAARFALILIFVTVGVVAFWLVNSL